LFGDEAAHGGFAGAHETNEGNVVNGADGGHGVSLGNFAGGANDEKNDEKHQAPISNLRRSSNLQLPESSKPERCS
jgi:hypothetical protein